MVPQIFLDIPELSNFPELVPIKISFQNLNGFYGRSNVSLSLVTGSIGGS